MYPWVPQSRAGSLETGSTCPVLCHGSCVAAPNPGQAAALVPALPASQAFPVPGSGTQSLQLTLAWLPFNRHQIGTTFIVLGCSPWYIAAENSWFKRKIWEQEMFVWLVLLCPVPCSGWILPLSVPMTLLLCPGDLIKDFCQAAMSHSHAPSPDDW